jgi:hypothetical protein
MQGAQKLRIEAHLDVRRFDEGDGQLRSWAFYETIKLMENQDERPTPQIHGKAWNPPIHPQSQENKGKLPDLQEKSAPGAMLLRGKSKFEPGDHQDPVQRGIEFRCRLL